MTSKKSRPRTVERSTDVAEFQKDSFEVFHSMREVELVRSDPALIFVVLLHLEANEIMLTVGILPIRRTGQEEQQTRFATGHIHIRERKSRDGQGPGTVILNCVCWDSLLERFRPGLRMHFMITLSHDQFSNKLTHLGKDKTTPDVLLVFAPSTHRDMEIVFVFQEHIARLDQLQEDFSHPYTPLQLDQCKRQQTVQQFLG